MTITNDLFKKLTFFSEPAFKEELLQHGQLLSFNKGNVIVGDGQYVKFLPIVLKGAIRVFQQSEDREILLYYVRAEETCTMSLAALTLTIRAHRMG
jgi:CRP/FNR family transcriptional regulator